MFPGNDNDAKTYQLQKSSKIVECAVFSSNAATQIDQIQKL